MGLFKKSKKPKVSISNVGEYPENLSDLAVFTDLLCGIRDKKEILFLKPLTWSAVAQPLVHSDKISTYAVAPTRSLVAYAGEKSRQVFIKDFRTGQEKEVLNRSKTVTALAWNRSEDLLAIGNEDTSVSLLKWPGGKPRELKIPSEFMKIYEKPLKGTKLVRISPNGSDLAVIYGQGELMSWKLNEDGAKVNVHHISRFTDVHFSHDGSCFAAVGSTFYMEIGMNPVRTTISNIKSTLFIKEIETDQTWQVTSSKDIYENVFWTSCNDEIIVSATRMSAKGEPIKCSLVFQKEKLKKESSESLAEFEIGGGRVLADVCYSEDKSQLFACLSDDKIHMFDLDFKRPE